MLAGIILNLIHILLILTPIIIFFIDTKFVFPLLKYITIIIIITPLHWVFFDNQCIFTLLTKRLGGMRETAIKEASFSEIYLKWLYYPIMKIFGWKWDIDGINRIVNVHWIINFILIWYYIFFIYCKK